MGIFSVKEGALGEEQASKYLKKQGYKIVERNFKCKTGEIDIIAKDGKTLCFVEVKMRANNMYGSPLEAISKSKLSKLKKASQYYVMLNGLEDADIRFDAVEILDDQVKLVKNITE